MAINLLGILKNIGKSNKNLKGGGGQSFGGSKSTNTTAKNSSGAYSGGGGQSFGKSESISTTAKNSSGAYSGGAGKSFGQPQAQPQAQQIESYISNYVTPTYGDVSSPVDDYSIDLSDILDSYTKSAQAQQQTIKDTTAASIKALQDSEASQRSTLSRALERFQKDTADQRNLLQSNFNSNRADLEAQAYMANRQAMQSAAARGIGGSGLQQLAQLQNLINQSTATNELASGNTEALTALAEALSRQEENTTTSLNDLANNLATQINNLNTAQQNQLNEIDANTTSLQNQLKYQEAVRAQDARTQAEQFAASLAAQNAATANQWELYNRQNQDAYDASQKQAINAFNSTLSDTQDAINAIKSGYYNGNSYKSTSAKNKAISDKINEAKSGISSIMSSADLPSNLADTYRSQLDSLYNSSYIGDNNSSFNKINPIIGAQSPVGTMYRLYDYLKNK